MATTTPYQDLPVPEDTDDPDVVDDLTNLAVAIEKRLAGVYNTTTDRDTRVTAPAEGQVAYLKDANTWTFYDGSSWTEMFAVVPSITSGTAAPSGGADGDIYFQHS
jgi:hypothetical protein